MNRVYPWRRDESRIWRRDESRLYGIAYIRIVYIRGDAMNCVYPWRRDELRISVETR